MEVMPKIKYAGGKVVPECMCKFFGITKEEATKIAQGICIGLHCKYKNPIVRVFEVNSKGGYVYLYDQR